MPRLLHSLFISAALLGAPAAVLLAPAASAADTTAAQPASYKQEELEQLVAPIALYPDSLVAQILMASTYPLEVVQAQRWRKANPKYSGAELEKAVNQQPWDASVKSLTAFPQVLDMMNDKIDWTQKLGDAFLADQKRVMDAIQVLRQRAQASGNLKSGAEQTVSTQSSNGEQIIIIQPAQPETVYVPVYNPTVVYGSWPYPYYTPYYWYPPGYAYSGAVFGFTAGLIVGGAFWGWGNCNWGHGNIDIDINNNFTRVDHYKRSSNGSWQHNAEHRRGVEYRDQGTRERYRNQQPGAATRDANRDAYRGRADSARQDLGKISPEQRDAINRDAANRDRDGSQNRPQTSDRATGTRDASRDAARPQPATRDSGTRDSSRAQTTSRDTPRSSNSLNNVNSPSVDRAASQRGASSRASTGSRSGGSVQRPARSGGGRR